MSGHIVFGNQIHGREIARRAGTPYDPMVDVVMSHVDGRNKLTGGVLYTDFTDASCFMHVASFRKNWGSRDLLWVAFDYPYRQLSLERIFVMTDERNWQALVFEAHLGFKEIARLPNSYKDGFARVVLAMDYEECKWLRLKPRRIQIGV